MFNNRRIRNYFFYSKMGKYSLLDHEIGAEYIYKMNLKQQQKNVTKNCCFVSKKRR